MTVNDLPNKWKIECLENVAKWGSGGTPTSTNPSFYNGNIPWLVIGDLNDGYISKSEKTITKLGLDNSSAKIVKPDSVLVAMYGSIGKLGINKIPLATNQAIAFTEEIFQTIYNKYLFHYLFHIREKLHSLGKGGTQKNISQTVLKKVQIPLPPLPEQLRIVAKIEELFSELDKGIETLKTAKQQLKVYRQAVLKYAFEGRLTNPDVKDGELPEGWVMKRIEELATTIGGIAFKSSDFLEDGQYQVIRIGNVRQGLIRYKENPVFLKNVEQKFLSKGLLRMNDIIITQTGTKGKRDYGFTAMVKSDNLLLNQRLAAIRCEALLLPQYLLYYTWTDYFKNQFFANETGNVGQGNVGIKGITESTVPMPSIEVQREIVLEIESRLSVCDKIEESIEQGLQQAEALRQSILKKAFEGKLVPQDPNDAPASMLLERIKAERADEQPQKRTRKKASV